MQIRLEQGNVAFLMKDVVLFAVSFYLLKQDVKRAVLSADSAKLSASQVLSENAGTRAASEPIPGLAKAQPLIHVEALEVDEIPEHLLASGASGRRGVSGSLIAMGVEQRGSAASLRILERQNQREVNGETPE
jgi:hypothetical protein